MGIIQCGSFVGNTTVNIGWEPQWIMIKRTDAAGDWIVIDSMRGCSVGGIDAVLNPNLANAESVSNDYIDFTATGFITKNLTGTYIYTVIRRPNKPPTSGIEIYLPSASSGVVNTGFPVDLHIEATRAGSTTNHRFHDRLRGGTKELVSSSDVAETTVTDLLFDSNTGLRKSFAAGLSNHFFRRAHGFFDVVCYTGAGGNNQPVGHNLGVTPELIICRSRSSESSSWCVMALNATGSNKSGFLNSTDTFGSYPFVISFSNTASQFFVGDYPGTNQSGATYVAYLFASIQGISKVGSYTGNGTSQTIDCGFSTGARFILIKRTDSTGDWYVWDSARGIVSANDPHLSLNTIAAEVTTDDSVDPNFIGFDVLQNSATNINISGALYMFLAIS